MGVATHYRDSGIFQSIARSRWFSIMKGVVSSIFLVWVPICVDWGAYGSFVHVVFFVYFLFDIVVRLAACQSCNLMCHWLVTDTCLTVALLLQIVTSMIDHVSMLRLSRVLFFLQLVRVSALLSAVPEAAILLKGMFAASRAVLFTLLLLVVNIFVFSNIFTAMLQGSETRLQHRYFTTVPGSMRSLFIGGILMDAGAELLWDMSGDEGNAAHVIIFIFFLVLSLSLICICAGVLLDVVSSIARAEKNQLTKDYFRNQIESFETPNMWSSKQGFLDAVAGHGGSEFLRSIGCEGVMKHVDVIFSTGSFDSAQDLADELWRFSSFGEHDNKPTYADFLKLEQRLMKVVNASADGVEDNRVVTGTVVQGQGL
eukprot:TRINITY_DN11468_c0_g1_i2.p1 TRINITY_DN11468_c0_g1~~TRINITY_DN11468_c0_g1_i2.p1  ORF type:complete len:370 (+),score=62.90 TRINITY_DN11468_c0_g1_i2:69-1178(+)